MELLLSSSVAVTAAISLLTMTRVSPLVIQFHIWTRSRPAGRRGRTDTDHMISLQTLVYSVTAASSLIT